MVCVVFYVSIFVEETEMKMYCPFFRSVSLPPLHVQNNLNQSIFYHCCIGFALVCVELVGLVLEVQGVREVPFFVQSLVVFVLCYLLVYFVC